MSSSQWISFTENGPYFDKLLRYGLFFVTLSCRPNAETKIPRSANESQEIEAESRSGYDMEIEKHGRLSQETSRFPQFRLYEILSPFLREVVDQGRYQGQDEWTSPGPKGVTPEPFGLKLH